MWDFNVECRYAECCYAECNGALFFDFVELFKKISFGITRTKSRESFLKGKYKYS
jgi:hypothetical protein